ncbi:hypothetical protein [Lysinibacillus sp. FSL L8-0126]
MNKWFKEYLDSKNNGIEVKVVKREIITPEHVATPDLEGEWRNIAD